MMYECIVIYIVFILFVVLLICYAFKTTNDPCIDSRQRTVLHKKNRGIHQW